VTFASQGDVEERLESTAASGIIEEDDRGAPGLNKNAEEVRTGELKREVQGRSGGASRTHRNLEL
jgi:hypothetical protein